MAAARARERAAVMAVGRETAPAMVVATAAGREMARARAVVTAVGRAMVQAMVG